MSREDTVSDTADRGVAVNLSHPGSVASAGDPRVVIFTSVWAAATLFHQFSFSRVGGDALELTVSAVAVAVLLRPFARFGLPALAAVQILDVAVRLPWVSNHWLTTGFVALAILVARPGTRGSDKAWFERFALPLRWICITLYFFAVFHKLNTDFLDPGVSCGATLARSLAEAVPGLGFNRGVGWAAIVGTLVVETAIPLALIFSRTRRAGLLGAMAFHFVLAIVPINVYYNFSAMLVGLFFAFVSPTDARWIHRRLHAVPRRVWRSLGVLVALLTVVRAFDSGHTAQWLVVARVAWIAYGLAVVAVLFALWRRPSDPARSRLVWRPRPWFLGVIPAVFIVSGASPYLGLKTENSLSMYSNLRTEGRSNHLLVRASVDGWQSDIVQILGSSEPGLKAIKRRSQALTWFEFRDRVSRKPDASVRFRRNGGEPEMVARAADDPRFAQPTPMIARKLLRFRPVDLRTDHRCSH